MPETPTPGVNGQVLSVPALQASMSISSLDPAASTSGSCASTATAGSFCLFAENGPVGLPLLTSTSPPAWALAVDWMKTAGDIRSTAAERTPTTRVLGTGPPNERQTSPRGERLVRAGSSAVDVRESPFSCDYLPVSEALQGPAPLVTTRPHPVTTDGLRDRGLGGRPLPPCSASATPSSIGSIAKCWPIPEETPSSKHGRNGV